MSERKLAHIERIVDIQPIEGKNNLDATVLGWHVMIRPNEFKVGDLVIYVETDSIMPRLPEYEFLAKYDYKVKTQAYFKGTFISQGLILPMPDKWYTHTKAEEGMDVTEQLGITKYLSKSEQEEITKQVINQNRLKRFMFRYSWFRRLFLSRKQKEGFPYWVSKTDEERIQNIPKVLEQFKDREVYVTEKVDYQSVTFTGKMIDNTIPIIGRFLPKKFQFVVCSRNMTTNDKGSLYWKIAQKCNIEQILKENPTLTIQGEQGDTKVQGNKYGIKEPTMWVFNIIDYEKNYHYNFKEIQEFCKKYNLQTVPILTILNGIVIHTYKIELSKLGSTVQELVEFSKGKSVINPNVEREGVVIRCIENGKKTLSFKVINPDFLIKHNL